MLVRVRVCQNARRGIFGLGRTAGNFSCCSSFSHSSGGYFIVKGAEKVILTQEQLSKNRIIIELDAKKQVSASVARYCHLVCCVVCGFFLFSVLLKRILAFV